MSGSQVVRPAHRGVTSSLACSSCASPTGRAFARLDETYTPRLSEQRIPHTYGPGEIVFHESSESQAVFCIQSGSAMLFRRVPNGGTAAIGIRSRGSVMGLRAAVLDLPYSTSAETLERSTICAISRNVLIELLGRSPALGVALLRQVARDTRASEAEFVARSFQHVSQRTARLLVALAGESGARGSEGCPRAITMKREDLALIVGTTRETLSRTLHELAQRGLIEIGPHDLRILDLGGLEESAGR